MASKELIEKVARELCLSDGMNPDQEVIAGQAAGYENFGPLYQSAERSQNTCGNRNYMEDARIAISTILAALQEPTRQMLDELKINDAFTYQALETRWNAALNASPLGEQSE